MKYWPYIKKYKINSIFVKNFFLSLSILLIPIVAANGVVINYYTKHNTMMTEEKARSEMKNVVDSMDQILKWVDVHGDYMVNDWYFMSFLLGTEEIGGSQNDALTGGLINNQLNKIKLGESVIDSVHLYSYPLQYVISNSGGGEIDKFYDRDFRNLAKRVQTQPTDSGIDFYVDNKDRRMMRIYKKLTVYTEKSGILCINILLSDLELQLEKFLSENHMVEIKDADGSNLFEIGQGAREHFLIQSADSDYNGMRYISYFPYSTGETEVLLAALALGSIVFAVVAAVFITFKTCMPIEKLIHIFENPEEWIAHNAIVPQNALGEIKYILEKFANRIYYSSEIEQKLSKRMLEIKQTQIDALSMQINPHFLFNALQILSMSASELTGGKNEVVWGIKLLSNILKYSLYSDGNTDTIKNEMEYTEAYVKLQNLKYCNRVHVTFDIKPEVLSDSTVKMVVQPLVENSYVHGIIPHRQTGNITVKAFHKERYLMIEVADDGIGMSREKIGAVKKELCKDTIRKEKSIGIYNIHKRVQLLFGDEYGITIDETVEQGAKFIIRQPIGTVKSIDS